MSHMCPNKRRGDWRAGEVLGRRDARAKRSGAERREGYDEGAGCATGDHARREAGPNLEEIQAASVDARRKLLHPPKV